MELYHKYTEVRIKPWNLALSLDKPYATPYREDSGREPAYYDNSTSTRYKGNKVEEKGGACHSTKVKSLK